METVGISAGLIREKHVDLIERAMARAAQLELLAEAAIERDNLIAVAVGQASADLKADLEGLLDLVGQPQIRSVG